MGDEVVKQTEIPRFAHATLASMCFTKPHNKVKLIGPLHNVDLK